MSLNEGAEGSMTGVTRGRKGHRLLGRRVCTRTKCGSVINSRLPPRSHSDVRYAKETQKESRDGGEKGWEVHSRPGGVSKTYPK